jgi:hypothetical protein
MRNIRWTTSALVAIGCAVGIGCATETAQTDQKNERAQHDSKECDDVGTGQETSLFALRDELRRLWTDHVAFTRFYIIESIAGLPGAQATAERLLHNQDEIGDAIKPFYGDAAGDALAGLLREHIGGAVAVLEAAKAGDRDALATATAAWFVNADEIAQFLADANPNLTFAALRDAMHVHLEQTIAEATARLTADWEADVRTFDEIVMHILDLADTLALGIAQQFPDRVSTDAVAGEEVHLAMRKLWEDHVIWTRNVIISVIASGPDCKSTLPDLQAALARLLRNQDDIGNAALPFVGDAGADRLTTLLREHITVAGEILFAAKANETAKLADAVERWYANADDIAGLLSDALGLPRAAVEEMMRTHLDQTLNEARHYLTGKFDQSVNDYDQIVKHILMMADAISAAL